MPPIDSIAEATEQLREANKDLYEAATAVPSVDSPEFEGWFQRVKDHVFCCESYRLQLLHAIKRKHKREGRV